MKVAPAISVVMPAFDNPEEVSRAVESLLKQSLPNHVHAEIRVVDDGSSEPLSSLLQARFGNACTVLRHAQNRGRAAARNTGAAGTQSRFILFFDSDCLPGSQKLLHAHWKAHESGADLSFGPLLRVGTDFWARYQRQISRSRMQALDAGDLDSQTVFNLCVRRSLFERAGGFDEAYREYGFEDRDLLLRLKRLGVRAVFAADAGAIHDGALDLNRVCNKLEVAGRFTSTIFRRKHPREYRARYGSFDVRERFAARLLARACLPFLSRWARWWNSRLESELIPYGVRSVAVRTACALAYLRGTDCADV